MNRRRRGSALLGVLAVMFIALIAILALHHQEAVSRRANLRNEAELRFREARRFALQERFLGTAPPSDLIIRAKIKDGTPGNAQPIPRNYAKDVFQREDDRWSGLPDLKKNEAAPAHKYLDLKAETQNASLQVFDKRVYREVETEVPGYAAYAPNGEIHLEQVEAWSNPTFGDANPTLEAYSGVPVVLGAKNDVQVENLVYGEAHSSQGNVQIGSGEGIGFVGPLPLPAYEDQIMGELGSANSTLFGSTNGADKTALLNGNPLSLGGIIDLFWGGEGVEGLVGLRQAFNFPMPMIPGLRQVVPGVVYEFWFHVPFPPDGGFSQEGNPAVAQLQTIADQLKQLQTEVDELKKQLDEATKKRQQLEQNSPGDTVAIDAARQAEQALQDQITSKTNDMKTLAEQSKALTESQASAGFTAIPVTRSQDPSGKDGVFGWNYSKVMGNMLGLLLDTITGDFKNIASRLSEEVRVVHFGRPDNVPSFQFGTNFVARATMTVPRGRTLQFNGNMEIQGDLWLQRGSVMAVNGNLSVHAPSLPSTTDPYPPSGRLFLEEGATLVVSGDFECQGSPQFGSVMVGGEPGEIHPLTGAILCNGNVSIPYGIYSGSTLEDLMPIDAAKTMIRPLLESGAPNVAKVAGPFHLRSPYFARYATTFQLTIVPPTLITPPIPVPTPVPMPKENILVFAFRALSLGYTAILNGTLGENFYTQCDWWPFGDGVVPMTTKIDPADLAQAVSGALGLLTNSKLEELTDLEKRAREFATTFIPTVMNWVVQEGIQKLVGEVALMLTPGMGAPVDAILMALIDKANDKEVAADALYADFVTRLNGTIASAAQDVLGKLLSKTDLNDYNDYLREHSGALVYAGRNLTIGSQARLASGMFVAGESLDVQAELTIGTLMARNGSVRARRLLYYPYFNQASLYVPRLDPSKWTERAQVTEYGVAYDSGVAVQVGPPPVTHRVMAEGWDR